MKNEILKRFFLVILISLLICSAIFSKVVTNIILEQIQNDMEYSLRIIDKNIDYSRDLQNQIENINKLSLSEDRTITLIDKYGNILSDTTMDFIVKENIIKADDVSTAIKNGIGVSKEYSSSIKKDVVFVTILSNEAGYLLRMSMVFNAHTSFFYSVIISAIISMILAFLISMLFASRFSKSITEPLAQICNQVLMIETDKAQFKKYKFEEINLISKAVEKMTNTVNASMAKLLHERNKIEYIIDNMSEGMVLIDENADVVTINKAGRRIFNCVEKKANQNIMHYTQNINIINSIEKSINHGDRFVFDFENVDKHIFSAYITKIQKGVFDEITSGVIVLLVDVTADRNAQKMRQEFFSNVSHEMKTPITSIQGFAELIESGIVKDEEQKKEFLQRIKKETQNMTNLINDILMISRLETKDLSKSSIPINVKFVIEDVISTVMPLAEKRSVTINTDVDEVFMKADSGHIHQLVNNLVVNAIKYNVDGGTVNIILKKKDNMACLIVEDTGIGIPTDAQTRIFERFYRIDKGRSKKMGGTGLGLSIVKHIVQFYHGSIKLKSKLDVGTTITVKFPIE